MILPSLTPQAAELHIKSELNFAHSITPTASTPAISDADERHYPRDDRHTAFVMTSIVIRRVRADYLVSGSVRSRVAVISSTSFISRCRSTGTPSPSRF